MPSNNVAAFLLSWVTNIALPNVAALSSYQKKRELKNRTKQNKTWFDLPELNKRSGDVLQSRLQNIIISQVKGLSPLIGGLRVVERKYLKSIGLCSALLNQLFMLRQTFNYSGIQLLFSKMKHQFASCWNYDVTGHCIFFLCVIDFRFSSYSFISSWSNQGSNQRVVAEYHFGTAYSLFILFPLEV